MRKELSWIMLLSATVVITTLYTRRAVATPATPPPAFVGTTLAVGLLGEVDVANRLVLPSTGHVWASRQKTRGVSDMYVQNNVWQPGGSTGWHSHPGHSLIVVTAGTITAYEGDDPDCKPHEYTQGMAFVDHGGSHVHIIRNEGQVDASTIAVQLVPTGTSRRIDADDPGNCRF
ncbi:MAG: cupin domain-containing protein [Acidobacteriaceae bacterium]